MNQANTASALSVGTLDARAMPTVWGMDWLELHARFWASRGVQIVRPGEKSRLVAHAELYLLLDKGTLALLRLAAVLDEVSWANPDLIIVRVLDRARSAYSERILTDDRDNFLRYQREYETTQVRIGRIVLTADKDLASVWQESVDAHTGWRTLRSMTRRQDRFATKLRGKLFDAARPEQLARFGHDLVSTWQRPDATIPRIRQVAPAVWADRDARVEVGPGIRGPLWVGAGREIKPTATAVGPAVMWDMPEKRPAEEEIAWEAVESLASPAPPALLRGRSRQSPPARPFKRAFDIVFAGSALLLTLPIFPLVALAIVLEDGRPVFFRHRRETLGGREFGCIKFRSMKKNSEEIKARLASLNQADGPQFFIKNDPRLTKVGAFTRELQIDELPQLWNILVGDMSVVGPRPSPFKENQYCPPWREARLSVRPGLTGLWQISRTRQEGNDFQEWIKYDIRYVERQNLGLDLWIIWRTFVLLVKRATST